MMQPLMSTSARSRRSRIARCQAALILSFAAAAALSLACGGKTDRGTTDAEQTDSDRTEVAPTAEAPTAAAPTGAAPEPAGAEAVPDSRVGFCGALCTPPPYFSPRCPDVPEAPGASCSGYMRGLTCEYDSVSPLSLVSEPCNGTSLIRHCSESTALWEELPPPTCSPPPPSCEATLPIAGSDCNEPGVDCSYRSECSGRGINTATCLGGQWLVVLHGTANCDPVRIVPVCPERELSTGEACAYPGQECSRETCEPGVSSRAGHLCSAGGVWQDSALLCPPDGAASD